MIAIRTACAVALAVAAVAMPLRPVAAAPGTTGQTIELADGLKYIDTKLGTGAVAESGHKVVVDYTGWLFNDDKKGKKFDSSIDRGQPFTFTLGAHEVIAGWDEGVSGMKAGGERTLIIPPDLGYGDSGAGGVIPPNATLIFDVKLIRVE
jgi:peptidylprolyl isomerase